MSSSAFIESNQISVVRETSYIRMDKLVWEMRQAKSGLEMKIQKTFFSSIPNACTGKELVQWLKVKLFIPTDMEALHIANALFRLGYVVAVNDKQNSVKLDNSCYRIQRPALWPSRKWEGTPQEYALYLLKKIEKGKSIDAIEQTHLANFSRDHKETFTNLKINAKDAVSRYNRGTRADKDIEDSQDRSFWRVHHPPNAHKTHHYSSNAFIRNSVCMAAIYQNRREEVVNKKIAFMSLYLQKAQHHSENTTEKTIAYLKNHSLNFEKHDSLINRQDATNPWIAIDEYFYEDLIELDEKKHTQLEVESWMLDFRELLKDSYGKGLFANFLQQEYSLENLYFWEACEDLKKCAQAKIVSKIQKIQVSFLNDNAQFEVNLDRMVVQATLKAMQTPSRYCMDKAQRQIYNLMKEDSYPRFLRSEAYRHLLLSFNDKRRDARDRIVFLKKLYQRRERKSSISSTSAKILVKQASKDSAGKSKFLSSSDLQSSAHASISPYYTRRASHASPNLHSRSPLPETDFAMRKAGSLSSLVVVNTNRKKQGAAKVTFDDEIERASDDSGTYSGIYSTATYSPKSKSTNKKTLRKKYSFS